MKIENDTYYVSFNIFSGVNIVRAYITNFNISLDDQGTKFERYVKDLLEKNFKILSVIKNLEILMEKMVILIFVFRRKKYLFYGM